MNVHPGSGAGQDPRRDMPPFPAQLRRLPSAGAMCSRYDNGRRTDRNLPKMSSSNSPVHRPTNNYPAQQSEIYDIVEADDEEATESMIHLSLNWPSELNSVYYEWNKKGFNEPMLFSEGVDPLSEEGAARLFRARRNEKILLEA